MANAAKKVRDYLTDNQIGTFKEIRARLADLRPAEISMALCYLTRQRYVSRIQIDGQGMGRKKVWKYEYHAEKLAKEAA